MRLAYCGVDCAACEVFQATANGDRERQARCAAEWTPVAIQHWGMAELKAEDMVCRGCRNDTGPLFLGCRKCPIRACCREHGFRTCAECREWTACERLAGLLADVPAARETLTRLSASA